MESITSHLVADEESQADGVADGQHRAAIVLSALLDLAFAHGLLPGILARMSTVTKCEEPFTLRA